MAKTGKSLELIAKTGPSKRGIQGYQVSIPLHFQCGYHEVQAWHCPLMELSFSSPCAEISYDGYDPN